MTAALQALIARNCELQLLEALRQVHDLQLATAREISTDPLVVKMLLAYDVVVGGPTPAKLAQGKLLRLRSIHACLCILRDRGEPPAQFRAAADTQAWLLRHGLVAR